MTVLETHSSPSRPFRDPRDIEIVRLKDRIEELEMLLGMNEVQPFHVHGFDRRMSQFLGLLLNRDFVAYDTARMMLSAEANSSKYVNCYVSRIRKALGPELRDCIQTVWGSGVFIEPKDKVKIRAWLEERRAQ